MLVVMVGQACHTLTNPSVDVMCAFKKMKNALRQHTSQIIPPETPAVRNRTWSASLPQNEQWRCFHSAVSASCGGCVAGVVAMVPLLTFVASHAGGLRRGVPVAGPAETGT